MLPLILILTFIAPAPPASSRSDGAWDSRVLRCSADNTAAGKNRKCHIKIPARAQIRACGAADKAARHCTLDPRFVAWTEPAKGVECKVNPKKTDWRTRVGVKVGKGTKPGAGRCELRVELR